VARSPKQKRPVVGLDIEPGAVNAAVVTVDGSLHARQVASASLPANVVRDGEVGDGETLTDVLKALFAEHKLPKRVRIGVANQRIVVRLLDLPPVGSPKELEAVVRFHAQEELPMRLDEAVIDFQPIGTVETPQGPRERVVLVAARRDMIEDVFGAARRAGLRPEGIDLSAFAMVRALSEDADVPTLYLSVGGLTNLAIAERGNVLFTRVSGTGVEGMAGVLAERAIIPIEEARALLMTISEDDATSSPDETRRMASAVIAEGVRRIAGEARASLDFHHTAGTGEAPVERAVVTGSAVNIAGFVPALAAELGLPAFTGAVDGDVDGAKYAVAAGLAVEEPVA
jgi:type IV pilus assembly protein PilM